MSGERTDLTLLKVNLVPHSVIALQAAATTTGDSQTDAVNRALQLYAGITATADVQRDVPGYGVFTFELSKGGRKVRIEVDRPWWRFW